ncbi:alpha/beta hydrolase [Camelimonas sp. ID_303_24]
MRWLFRFAAGLLAVGVVAAGGAILFGGPRQPPVFPGLSEAFGAVDYSSLPPLSYYAGADGVRLAYRRYPAQERAGGQGPAGSVVLVHGSSATSNSMHALALALSGAGHPAYALDIRGHGSSGVKGHVDRIGQLDDDLARFMEDVKPVGPVTLVGFSSGGGFALRIATGSGARQFQSYLLLAPFVSIDSPAQRPNSGGWVSVGMPRVVALMVLNGLGISAGNGLPVARFGVNPRNQERQTGAYDYNLLLNFGPPLDYRAAIRAVTTPLMVVAGAADNMFHADRFAEVFAPAPGLVGVRLVPGVDHAGLILAPAALAEIVASVHALQTGSR